VSDYYSQEVRGIIDAASQGLSERADRRFIYVEVAFFQLWWREQTPEWRAEVRKQVNAGQLQFVNAGW